MSSADVNAKGNVLVVDDEPDIRAFLEFVLSRVGYTVSIAADAQEALGLAKACSPILVLTDLRMPGQYDGYALIKLLRPEHPQTRFVLMTGNEDMVENQENGPDGVLYKPFRREELLALVNDLLAPPL